MDYIECCEIQIKGILVGDIEYEDFPGHKVELMWVDGKIKTSNSFKKYMSEEIKEGQSLILDWTYICDWAEACHGLLIDIGDYVGIEGTLQQSQKDFEEGNSIVHIAVKSISRLNPDGSIMDWDIVRNEYEARHPTNPKPALETEYSSEEKLLMQKYEEDICIF